MKYTNCKSCRIEEMKIVEWVSLRKAWVNERYWMWAHGVKIGVIKGRTIFGMMIANWVGTLREHGLLQV